MQRGPRNHYHTRGSAGGAGADTGDGKPPPESDVFLHWGNRKRLRCVKIQRREDDDASGASAGRRRTATAAAAAAGVRAERRVVRAEKEAAPAAVVNPNPVVGPAGPTSPRQRLPRNSEAIAATKATGTIKPLTSPERGGKAGGNGNGGGGSASADDKAGGGSGSGGSSSASEGSIWPKFAIALTNKEKEEDFLILKGSKLPQRPKKRTKLIQKTVNLVSPGTWLCDLTLDRYEVREKKTSKKKPRGLKAMGSMESDSE